MLDRFVARSRHLAHRLSWVIPSSCALCGASGNEALCNDCRKRFFGGKLQRCPQCGLPMSGHAAPTPQPCGACLTAPPAFDATIVVADYAAPVDHLVLALKFGNRLPLAALFAQLMQEALLQAQIAPQPDVLAAIPLSEKRLAERGFNQALEIAKPLAHATGIPLMPTLLDRTRDTLMQARLHPDQRRQNIHRAFSISLSASNQLKGKHVAVVDDVMTTGETLNEIAVTLKRHGAVRITNLVFARTPPK